MVEISQSEAKELGLQSITYPYAPEEREACANALRSFNQSPERQARIVKVGRDSVEVWALPYQSPSDQGQQLVDSGPNPAGGTEVPLPG